tara:strand:+ start:2534 stop:3277 length:744 start_codon:yes stop_codon:yes gene_type:complete
MEKKVENYERLLGVNIDHVATLRQARGTRYPEPIQAALMAEHAGADSITLHLREDRRHIQERDVSYMIDTLQTRMNLEMAATSEMLSIAKKVKPSDCCLVPEKREELTTEGGLDVVNQIDYLRDFCQELKESGIRVSLFIDANKKQIEAAAKIGVPVIEIHTGHFANATNSQMIKNELLGISEAVNFGIEHELQVNAGHGLDYHNVKFIAEINGIVEFNIGHSIISRAIFDGLEKAVSDMKNKIQVK